VLGVGEQRWREPDGHGVRPRRTLWDLLALLVVPLMLLLLAQHYTGQQDRRDRGLARQARQQDLRVAADERRQQALQRYLEQMTGLLLDHHLAATKSRDAPARVAAHALTLTVLPQLDGTRKSQVVRFLIEARLIRSHGRTIVGLRGADLRGVDLRDASLTGLDFAAADLRGARFDGADLEGVDLRRADLRGASMRRITANQTRFSEATAVKASFWGARMGSDVLFEGADLTFADFGRADLFGEDFGGATLRGASFDHARLGGLIDLRDACVTDTSFAYTTASRDRVAYRADFESASGARTDFTGADLRGFRLVYAPRLIDPKLDHANNLPAGWRPHHRTAGDPAPCS
jgi:uncharacterized protein YjbI with pentapeptide repeats